MGTSRRWTGADAGIWRRGDEALNRWTSTAGNAPILSKSGTEAIGNAYLGCLQRAARAGKELEPIRDAMITYGARLPAAIERALAVSVRAGGTDSNGAHAVTDVAVIEGFLDDLGAGGGTLLDAVVRRAASETLTAAGGAAAGDGVFCLLYRMFFAQVVSQFITTVIAEKVKLAVPVLRAVDPAGEVAAWVAKRVFSLLPNPCDVPVDNGGSLTQLADSLVHETVDRALGDSTAATSGGA